MFVAIADGTADPSFLRMVYSQGQSAEYDNYNVSPVGSFDFNKINIGGNTGGGYTLNGRIGSVILWNKRLTSSELNDVNNHFISTYNMLSTPTPTPVPTSTPTPTPTNTPTATPTATPLPPTATPTPTPTGPTATPTNTPTPSPPTPTPTITNTPTPTPLPYTDGYTILVNDTTPSYPGTGTTWTSIATGTTSNATMINGPVWSGGTPGFFTFDGTNDYGNFGPSSRSATTGSCTFGAWFRTTTSATQKIIAMRGLDGSGIGWSLFITKSTTNKMTVGVVTTTPLVGTELASTTTLVDNTWYYVYGVWTQGTNLKIYVNGSLENTVSVTGTGLRDSLTGWILMRGNGGTYSNGSVSEFVIYNTVLSDAQILNNFNFTKYKYGY